MPRLFITGATSGIGLEAVHVVSSHVTELIIAARDASKVWLHVRVAVLF